MSLEEQIDKLVLEIRIAEQGQRDAFARADRATGEVLIEKIATATQSIKSLVIAEIIAELERLLVEQTIHKDKKPGDLDRDGNVMQSKVRTGYNHAKAEMRHHLKDRIKSLKAKETQL